MADDQDLYDEYRNLGVDDPELTAHFTRLKKLGRVRDQAAGTGQPSTSQASIRYASRLSGAPPPPAPIQQPVRSKAQTRQMLSGFIKRTQADLDREALEQTPPEGYPALQQVRQQAAQGLASGLDRDLPGYQAQASAFQARQRQF